MADTLRGSLLLAPSLTDFQEDDIAVDVVVSAAAAGSGSSTANHRPQALKVDNPLQPPPLPPPPQQQQQQTPCTAAAAGMGRSLEPAREFVVAAPGLVMNQSPCLRSGPAQNPSGGGGRAGWRGGCELGWRLRATHYTVVTDTSAEFCRPATRRFCCEVLRGSGGGVGAAEGMVGWVSETTSTGGLALLDCAKLYKQGKLNPRRDIYYRATKELGLYNHLYSTEHHMKTVMGTSSNYISWKLRVKHLRPRVLVSLRAPHCLLAFAKLLHPRLAQHSPMWAFLDDIDMVVESIAALVIAGALCEVCVHCIVLPSHAPPAAAAAAAASDDDNDDDDKVVRMPVAWCFRAYRPRKSTHRCMRRVAAAAALARHKRGTHGPA
jgi:hypothetical protein